MKVYGYDFAYSGICGTSVSGQTVKFSYIDLDTGKIESPAFEITLTAAYQVMTCDSVDIIDRFHELCLPQGMNLDSIDVLIPIACGWLLLDPYHYGYGLQYNEVGSIVSTDVEFKYLDLR